MRALLLALPLLAGLMAAETPAWAQTASPPSPQAPAPSADERAVADVFEKAQTALEQRRGGTASDLMVMGNLAALEAIREAARSGDSIRLGKLEPADRFAALGLRRHLSPTELRRMDLGGLADHALKQEWLGPNVIRQAALGPVRVRGDRATALLLVNNKPAIVQADFLREPAGWRIDLTNVLMIGNQFLKGFAAMNGKTEDAYIEELLRKLPVKK